MTVTRISPSEAGCSSERRSIRSLDISAASSERMEEWFNKCAQRAGELPGGFVRKVVWDKAGGYPKHAWGYIQYSARPFVPGYGCDGTTDDNVHLMAATLFERIGVDYAKAMAEAYDDTTLAGARRLMRRLKADAELARETIMPAEPTVDALMLALSDLYQINNRSLVEVLETKALEKGIDLGRWCFEEERLKAESRARVVASAGAMAA
jgi:hypothetical protein